MALSKVSKRKAAETCNIADISFPNCNYVARFVKDPAHPEFDDVCSYLQSCPLQYAFSKVPKMSKFLLGNFWINCEYDDTTKEVRSSVLTLNDISFNVDDVRRILHLPQHESYSKFPLGNEHEEMVQIMNYVQDDSWKSPGTLLRRQMGGVWNYLFVHVIQCLSRKTGGVDQSPKCITQLTHALISRRKIDFGQYFFDEMLKTINVKQRRNQVAYQRFFSMIIEDKLAEKLTVAKKIAYDIEPIYISKTALYKAANEWENSLPTVMIEFVKNPTMVWELAEETVGRQTAHPKKVSSKKKNVNPIIDSKKTPSIVTNQNPHQKAKGY